MLPENDPLGIKDFEDKEVIALDLVEVVPDRTGYTRQRREMRRKRK